jgi:hypothetical protein
MSRPLNKDHKSKEVLDGAATTLEIQSEVSTVANDLTRGL